MYMYMYMQCSRRQSAYAVHIRAVCEVRLESGVEPKSQTMAALENLEIWIRLRAIGVVSRLAGVGPAQLNLSSRSGPFSRSRSTAAKLNTNYSTPKQKNLRSVNTPY